MKRLFCILGLVVLCLFIGCDKIEEIVKDKLGCEKNHKGTLHVVNVSSFSVDPIVFDIYIDDKLQRSGLTYGNYNAYTCELPVGEHSFKAVQTKGFSHTTDTVIHSYMINITQCETTTENIKEGNIDIRTDCEKNHTGTLTIENKADYKYRIYFDDQYKEIINAKTIKEYSLPVGVYRVRMQLVENQVEATDDFTGEKEITQCGNTLLVNVNPVLDCEKNHTGKLKVWNTSASSADVFDIYIDGIKRYTSLQQGWYVLWELPVGTYKVRAIQTAGYWFSPADISRTITILQCSTYTQEITSWM